MSWLRYILTVPILVALLTIGVAEAARSAWRFDPLGAGGVLIAPDQIIRPGRPGLAVAFLRSRSGLGHVPLTGTMVTPGERAQLVHTVVPAMFIQSFDYAPGSGQDILFVQFRLSPEYGFGPLQTHASAFLLDPRRKIVAVDLEGIRSSGRYEWGLHRDWLLARLAGRQPVYLADVRPEEYNELHAVLQAFGWPAGPLVAWQYSSFGKHWSRDTAVGDLLRHLPRKLDLAVVADIADNQTAFRRADSQPVEVWPGSQDG